MLYGFMLHEGIHHHWPLSREGQRGSPLLHSHTPRTDAPFRMLRLLGSAPCTLGTCPWVVCLPLTQHTDQTVPSPRRCPPHMDTSYPLHCPHRRCKPHARVLICPHPTCLQPSHGYTFGSGASAGGERKLNCPSSSPCPHVPILALRLPLLRHRTCPRRVSRRRRHVESPCRAPGLVASSCSARSGR